MELIMATQNNNKVVEIQSLLPSFISLQSMADIGFTNDIDEPFETLHENAYIKAKTIYDFCGKNVFADDSGLFVSALDGKPGVRSARYAGEKVAATEHIKKLLVNLFPFENKKAFFKTSICLILEGVAHYFEGEIEGEIIDTPRGEFGFGYDPIFVPLDENRTFAEMDLATKNKFSHRKKAFAKMITHLQSL